MLLQYQNVFQNNPHMTSVLEMIYKDILEFHQQALRVFGKSGKIDPHVVQVYCSAKIFSFETDVSCGLEGLQCQVQTSDHEFTTP